MDVKPILFSGPMVRALLEGRKTQTRRVLDAACDEPPAFVEGGVITAFDENDRPYRWPRTYAVGDLLWVRETWQTGSTDDGPQISYRATPDFFQIDAWDGADEGTGPSFNYARCPSAEFSHWLSDVLANDGPWRPGIHMPRWASRLTLEVTDVRVQRLQEISVDDTDAEVFGGNFPHIVLPELFPDADKAGELSLPECFSLLWDSINASRGFGWDANPWVAAISFRVHPMNIDEFIAANHAMEGAVWPTPAS